MATKKNSAVSNSRVATKYPNKDFQEIYESLISSTSGSASDYPSMMSMDEFKSLYDNFLSGLGYSQSDISAKPPASMSRDDFNALYSSILSGLGYSQDDIKAKPPASMTQEEFQTLYDNIRAGMGDDDALKANLEAAMRPGLEQSIAQLQQRRRENNAAIDVDAASRGMGNSTWVTDAKLQQLRNAENNIAALNADYNANLYSNLMNAIGQRDQNAYNQASMFMNAQNQDRMNAWNAAQQAQQTAYGQATNWMNAQNQDALNAWNAAQQAQQSAYNQAANWMNMQNQDKLNQWNAQQQSQQSAYSQAMQWWQILHPQGGSGGGSQSYTPLPMPEITPTTVPATDTGTNSQLHQYLTDAMNAVKPSSSSPGRASVNPWNLNLLKPTQGQYTR